MNAVILKRNGVSYPQRLPKSQNYIEFVNENANDENALQKYLELNPRYIPQQFMLNHGLHLFSIVSKFIINDGMITDFMYITKSSVAWNIVFIELERADIKIFKKDKRQISLTANFERGYNQILNWKSYADNNSETLKKKLSTLLVPDYMSKNPVHYKYILVVGRNSEYKMDYKLTSVLDQRNSDCIRVMSYDSLVTGQIDFNGENRQPELADYYTILSPWRTDGYKIKYLPHNLSKGVDLLYDLSPTQLFITDEQKKELKKHNYQIDKWSYGEKLSVNGKYTSLSKCIE